jgi:small-conductance mechanosensitive channel
MKKRSKTSLILTILLTLFSASSSSLHAAPNPAASPDATEKKTATELPSKRKLPTAQTIDVERRETDRQIAARLNRIAQSQDIFRKVHVDVVEGVVTVRGEIEEENSAKSFTGLCEKVEGVIGVVDQLRVTSVKKSGLSLAHAEVSDLARKFFRFLPYLASCFFILALTLLLGYGCFRLWDLVLSRRMPRKPLVARNLAKVLTLPVYLLGFYVILQVGGLGGLAATLVGGTGVMGIVIGLAGKNIIENVLSSFMLTLRNPFKIGDQVIIGAERGVVHRIDSRCTMLLNSDGVFTQIPNSMVLAAIIKNVSAHPLNRFSFTLSVNKDVALPQFGKIFDRAIEENRSRIAREPKPEYLITEIAGDSVKIECDFWVDTEKNNLGRAKSDMLETVLYYLDELAVEAIDDPVAKAAAEKRLANRRRSLDRSRGENRECRPEADVLGDRAKKIRPPEADRPNRRDLVNQPDYATGT